jgi:hypothetical protein
MNGSGITVTIYCNRCGDVFSTTEHHQRFCSTTCSSGFWSEVRGRDPRPAYAWAQAAILTVLREHAPHWVARGEILRALYGEADANAGRAFQQALARLRGTWESAGLTIACRVERTRFDRDGATWYRLERDVEQVEVE